MFKRFPHYKQYDEMDCGPTCLRIICQYYGKTFSLEYLRKLCNTGRFGSSLLSVSEAAEQLGFRTTGARMSFDALAEARPFPCIGLWNQRHFIVIYQIKGNRVYVSDPAHGLLVYRKEEFMSGWAVTEDKGIVLTVDESAILQTIAENDGKSGGGLRLLTQYLLKYKRLMLQLVIGLLAGSLLQLIFPFLTQSIVDVGIQHNNLSFVYLILLAQLFLFAGKTTIEILRGYILMHLSSRININLLSDFFHKIMRLPLGYFDTKMTGDFLQRISDHQRVETFLTSGTLNVIFSLINMLVFCVVLGVYSPMILSVFIVGSIGYFGWISFFMKRRADLDYKRFTLLAGYNDKNLEMIHGMQEIKLHNAERKTRWQWEHLQLRIFKTSMKGLHINQTQTAGASLINELKNIFISFLAARLVLQGNISLGAMLSISYIIGQLNAPILQLVEFMKAWQEAHLSVQRIDEIHARPDEEQPGTETIQQIPDGDIELRNVSFKYDKGSRSPYAIRDLSMSIAHQKITAIVGASGSGKTTLLKLLLRFYEPESGNIHIAHTPLTAIKHSSWRDNCGVVMQEGYIFNDTIANNIAVGANYIDEEKLHNAARIANIHEFVQSLPMSYNSKLGRNGIGLSTGQKQRILIARAVYKDPQILFFDEATSALDARNERVIIENLNEFFEGKTVVVIAHRLSTVKNADQIIVMEKGQIAEVGTHASLIQQKGNYFHLVKNQLELGE